jgi:hypothetical protein
VQNKLPVDDEYIPFWWKQASLKASR